MRGGGAVEDCVRGAVPAGPRPIAAAMQRLGQVSHGDGRRPVPVVEARRGDEMVTFGEVWGAFAAPPALRTA